MARFSDDEIRRYGRQMVLAEVGGRGQERLRAARVAATHELAALYLAGAGVGTVLAPSEEAAAKARALNPLVTVEVQAQGEPAPAGDPASAAVEAARAATRAIASVLLEDPS